MYTCTHCSTTVLVKYCSCQIDLKTLQCAIGVRRDFPKGRDARLPTAYFSTRDLKT